MTAAKLTATDTVLIVVDLQERLLPAIDEHQRVISNARLLLRAATALALPVLMTTQYLKGLGPTHADVAELAPREVPVDKLTFSCFGSPVFRSRLEETGRKTVLLCGVETHICVLQTCLDAITANHTVHIAADATSSRTGSNAHLGLSRMEQAGTVISSTEMAIYELLRASGTEAFRALLPYLK